MKHTSTLVMGTGAMVILLLGFFLATFIPIDGEEVDCYDRHHNRIIGEQCVVENGVNSRTSAFIGFGVMSLIAAAIMIGTGIKMDRYEQ